MPPVQKLYLGAGKKREASEENYWEQIDWPHGRKRVTNEHCQPVDRATFATDNDAAANSLALELYCYWKPEAPCVGRGTLTQHRKFTKLVGRSHHDRTNTIHCTAALGAH